MKMGRDWKSFESCVVDEDWTGEVINYCKSCPNRWVHGVFHNCYTEGCQTPDALMGREGHRNIHDVLLEAGMSALSPETQQLAKEVLGKAETTKKITAQDFYDLVERVQKLEDSVSGFTTKGDKDA